jgi:hypothetical protein
MEIRTTARRRATNEPFVHCDQPPCSAEPHAPEFPKWNSAPRSQSAKTATHHTTTNAKSVQISPISNRHTPRLETLLNPRKQTTAPRSNRHIQAPTEALHRALLGRVTGLAALLSNASGVGRLGAMRGFTILATASSRG